MKSAVELDIVEIADQLNNLSDKAAVMAAAVAGLNGLHPAVENGLEKLAWEIHDAISAISARVLPARNRDSPQARYRTGVGLSGAWGELTEGGFLSGGA
jgi:hypothetical protein